MIDYNALYQECYEKKNAASANLRAFRRQANDVWDAAIHAEQKRRQPTKRKHFEPLPEQVKLDLKEKYQRKFFPKNARLNKVLKTWKGILKLLADHVTPVADTTAMHMIKRHAAYDYTGTSRNFKATQDRDATVLALKCAGFKVHVQTVTETYESREHWTHTTTQEAHIYYIWSNCPPWFWEAASDRYEWDRWVKDAVQYAADPPRFIKGGYRERWDRERERWEEESPLTFAGLRRALDEVRSE